MSRSKPLVRQRTAFTLFCDDVRIENSGKLIVIGLYGDVLSVTSVPAQLTLKAIVTVATPVERPFRELTVRAYHDDQVIHEDKVSWDALAPEAGDPPNADRSNGENGAVPVHFVRGLLTLQLTMANAGSLRVRIETEDEILPAGAIRLVHISN